MEKKPEAIVESLLGEASITEGDVHGLMSSLDSFDRIVAGQDFLNTYAALQTIKPEVWGHLPGEVVGALKSKLDTARVGMANALAAAKAAVAKAHAYKPPAEYPGYDSAAHSGEHVPTAHGLRANA